MEKPHVTPESSVDAIAWFAGMDDRELYEVLQIAIETAAARAHERDDEEVIRRAIVEPLPKVQLVWDALAALEQLYGEIELLENELEESLVGHEPQTPKEGDRGYICDRDSCRIAPHYQIDSYGAYEYTEGKWRLRIRAVE